MKLRLLVLAVLSVLAVVGLVPTPAAAQTAANGLNLSWDDCGSAGVVDKTVANCAALTSGSNTYYGSFVVPAGGLGSLNSAEIYIGIVSSSASMPAWWTIGIAPNCRPGSSMTMAYNTACGSATDYWSLAPSGPSGGANYIVDPPAGSANAVPGPNHAIHRGVCAISALETSALTAGTEVYCMTVAVKNNAQNATCAGCTTPMCLLFNALNLGQNAPDPNYTLSGPGAGGRDFITWQGGAGANCAEVPNRVTTWGQIKSIYR